MGREVSGWRGFWDRVLSPQTARFVLALLALGCSAYGANKLINTGEGGAEAGQAAVFAVGQLFTLAALAFGYYFGSTARGDERPQETKIVNTADEAVPVEESQG